MTIAAFAGGYLDPAFCNAIFLNRGPLFALEADANTARKRRFVEKLAEGVDGKPIGRQVIAVCHDQRLYLASADFQ